MVQDLDLAAHPAPYYGNWIIAVNLSETFPNIWVIISTSGGTEAAKWNEICEKAWYIIEVE